MTRRVDFDQLDLGENNCTTYEGKPFTGLAFEENLHGQLIGEVPFVDGLESGVGREWDDSGTLRLEEGLAHGSSHGVSRTWDERGQLKSELEYLYSIVIREKRWSRAGQLERDWQLPQDDSQRELIAEYEALLSRGIPES